MRRRLLLLCVFAALYTACSVRRDFWYPDEPDLAQVTREMAASGRWLEPSLLGQAFADYPPLFFWLTSAAGLIGGFNEAALRMPTLLSAVALLALTSVWARRRLGEDAAFWGSVVLGTTYFFVWQAVNCHLDMVFAALFAAGLFCYDLSRDARTGPGRVGLAVGAAVALGLASLTKGPAGFVLPLAVLGTLHLVRREWRELVRLAWVGAGAVTIFLAWSAAYASGGVLTMFSRSGDMPAEASALAFYGLLTVRVIDSGEQIEAFHTQQPNALLVLRDSHLSDLLARTSLRATTVRRFQVGSDGLRAVRLVPPADGATRRPGGPRGRPESRCAEAAALPCRPPPATVLRDTHAPQRRVPPCAATWPRTPATPSPCSRAVAPTRRRLDHEPRDRYHRARPRSHPPEWRAEWS